MKLEVIATGDELIRGQVREGNSFWLLGELARAGVSGQRVTIVGDSPGDIESAVRAALSRSDVVVICGGLGPTEDDRTAETVSKVLGLPLVEDPLTRAKIEARWRARGRTPPERTFRQARVPFGASVLENTLGTAAPFSVESGGSTIFCLPGVPREFQQVCVDTVIPQILSRRQRARVSRTIRCLWIPESELETLLEEVARQNGIELGLRAAYPETWATFYAEGDLEQSRRRAGFVAEQAVRLVGDRCYSTDDRSLPEVTGSLCLWRGVRLAVAESCTGGLLGAALTSVAGSSEYFVGGAVTYSNEEKVRALGVPAELISSKGAVSEPVVRAMAEGVRTRTGATHGVSITGIAGPGGGSPEKPVGTVWIALATESSIVAELHQLRDVGRENVRRAAVAAALDLLRRSLREGN